VSPKHCSVAKSEIHYIFGVTYSLLIPTELAVILMIYDWVIRRRQNKIMDSAIRTNEIVTSLFPKQVRDRMYTSAKKEGNRREGSEHASNDGKQISVYGSEPIADLYVSATGKYCLHFAEYVFPSMDSVCLSSVQ